MRRALTLMTAAAFAFLITRCAPDASLPVTLLVAAASDLATAMPEVAATFERETGIRVDFTFASSGQLAQQILQGAPVDVFLSADRNWVERLDSAGKLVPGSIAPYAYGRLVVVVRKNSPALGIERLGDPATGRVAVANPEHAPYGRAAREALAAAGVLGAAGNRLIIAENVRQTMQMVETGAVDVAISALSLVRADVHDWTLVPQELHAPLLQTAAVVANQAHAAEAQAFVHFLLGPAGRGILSAHTFDLPGS